MAQLTIDGIYRNGQVELSEMPVGVDESRVKVTFINETEDEAAAKRRAAGRKLIELLQQGASYGGDKFNREEIYEERMQELDRRRGVVG